MAPKINGIDEARLSGERLTFTPFEGGSVGGTYEGLATTLAAMIPSLELAGYSVNFERDRSPLARLSFSAAYSQSSSPTPNQDYKDTWELVRNTVQKELLQSDHPLISQIGAGNLEILKNLISGSGPDVWTGDPTTTFKNEGTADYDAAVYLWDMWNAGEKSLEVKQPILRLTRSTNPFYDTPFYTGNIDTILTTDSMIADSGVPANFAIPLVDLANQLILKSPVVPGTTQQIRSDSLQLYFGWRKDLVGSSKHGSQRIQYVLEYQFGLWDAQTYGVPQ